MTSQTLSAAEDAQAARVTVESRKYDGSLGRSWSARLVRREGPLVVLDGTFSEEVRHPLLGTIQSGTRSVEFYWEDRWYSVFRFHEPGGRLRNFYCNVNTPARFDGHVLGYVDLDIDVLVWPDFTLSVLDVEEFEEHAARYGYPEAVVRGARAALDELLGLIGQRRFPFDQTSL